MDDQQPSSANRAFSPYLRKPIRRLEEVHQELGHRETDGHEQRHDWLDNNLFRTTAGS